MVQPIPNNRPSFLTAEEVAHELRVTPATVRNMIKRGDLRAVQTKKNGRGAYRIPIDSFNAFVGLPPTPEHRKVSI